MKCEHDDFNFGSSLNIINDMDLKLRHSPADITLSAIYFFLQAKPKKKDTLHSCELLEGIDKLQVLMNPTKRNK